MKRRIDRKFEFKVPELAFLLGLVRMKRLQNCLKSPFGISVAGTDPLEQFYLLLFCPHTSHQRHVSEKSQSTSTLSVQCREDSLNKSSTLESILKTDSSKRVRKFKAAES